MEWQYMYLGRYSQQMLHSLFSRDLHLRSWPSSVSSLLTAAANELSLQRFGSFRSHRGILGVPPFLLFLMIWYVVVLGMKGELWS
jgi:hypothetical protein